MNKPSILKTVVVFMLLFVAMFVILNVQNIYIRLSNLFGSNENNEAYNLELENFYKEKYKDLNYLLPFGQASVNPVQNQPSLTTTQPVNSTYTISIPKIGITAPIVASTNPAENQIMSDLRKGVVLYPGAALPGQPGTSVIIGHSSSSIPAKYGHIFAGLNKLNFGDIIYIDNGSTKYTYTVTDKKLGSPKELMSLNFNNDLILSSCWPVGTAQNRVIIAADLN